LAAVRRVGTLCNGLTIAGRRKPVKIYFRTCEYSRFPIDCPRRGPVYYRLEGGVDHPAGPVKPTARTPHSGVPASRRWPHGQWIQTLRALRARGFLSLAGDARWGVARQGREKGGCHEPHEGRDVACRTHRAVPLDRAIPGRPAGFRAGVGPGRRDELRILLVVRSHRPPHARRAGGDGARGARALRAGAPIGPAGRVAHAARLSDPRGGPPTRLPPGAILRTAPWLLPTACSASSTATNWPGSSRTSWHTSSTAIR